MDRTRWAIPLLLLVGGCSSRAEDYAVYSAVINELTLRKTDDRPVQIAGSTVFSVYEFGGSFLPPGSDPWTPGLGNLGRLVPESPAKLLESFKERNQRPFPLEKRFEIRSDYVLGDLGEFVADTRLCERISLSGIGFSPSGQEALVFARILIKQESSEACILRLEKVNGAWLVRSIRWTFLAYF